jgi:ribonuclease P protein component
VLTKTRRLRNRRDFKQVYARGRSYVHPMLVLYVLPVRGDQRTVGFSVSKKLGGAVERNRVKRRLREVFRPWMDELKPGFMSVVVARSRVKDATFPDLKAAVGDLLSRARLKTLPDGQECPPCGTSSQ